MTSEYSKIRRLETSKPTSLPAEAVPAEAHPESRAYLLGRGLSLGEIKFYDLHYCAGGFWSRRVIIPMYDEQGTLLAFQGRHLDDEEPRYKTQGPRPIYMPDFEAVMAGSHLVICEGPFDAFAILRAGWPAVATLGILPSPAQVDALITLAKSYQRVLIWFDTEATGEAFGLQMKLQPHIPTIVVIEPTIKDPGECDPNQIQKILGPIFEKRQKN